MNGIFVLPDKSVVVCEVESPQSLLFSNHQTFYDWYFARLPEAHEDVLCWRSSNQLIWYVQLEISEVIDNLCCRTTTNF